MGSFNLKSYQERYAEVLRHRFPDKHYDLRKLDPLWNELRSGHPLKASHVEALFNEDNSHFGQFWKLPADLRERFKGKQINLQIAEKHLTPLWLKRRRTVVATLFRILGSIDTASILLRCVYPREFGVYSPPTLSFLQLELKEPVDHYLDYCDELRVWADRFKIKDGGAPSVGDTEKALWVFYEIAYGPERDRANAVDCQREFLEDEWIRARRAQNFLRPFLRHFHPLEQARLLSGIDPSLAGKIAGCELENLVKIASQSESVRDNINDFVTKYPARGLLRELHKAWDLRCDAIHNLNTLTGDQAQQIIKAVDRVQKALAP